MFYRKKEAAQKFGNGKIALTTRLTLEVQGLTYDNIEPFNTFIAQAGLYTGGTGSRVRPIDTITAKTLAAGKAVGTTAASAEAAKALMAKGVQYILLSSDEGIIVKWGKETISRIRG